MTGWERNAKRAVKAVIWVAVVLLLGHALDVRITTPVMIVISVACFADFLLDLIWPTGKGA